MFAFSINFFLSLRGLQVHGMFYFRLNTNKCPGPRWFGLVTGYRSFHLEVISYIQSGSVRPKAAAARQRPAPARNGLGGSAQMGAACPRRAVLCRAEQGCSCPLGTFAACPEPWGCATGAHIQQQGCGWPGAVPLAGRGRGERHRLLTVTFLQKVDQVV